MPTPNYTGLACLAVLKLRSGLCQLFGTNIEMQPKQIAAGSVTVIASLLNSFPDRSASPDRNPWMGKSAPSMPEDCQGQGGRLLQPLTALQHPAWLPKIGANGSRQWNHRIN